MRFPAPLRSLCVCTLLATRGAWSQAPAPVAVPPPPAPVAPAVPAPAAPSIPVAASAPGVPGPPVVEVSDGQAYGKLSPLAEAPDWSRLTAFTKQLTAEEFDAAMRDIYSDGKGSPVPWKRDGLGIIIPTGEIPVRVDFATANDKPSKSARFWRTATELPALENRPVLSDLVIAVDAGHIGGAYAKLEERWVSFNPQDPKEGVMEGEATLAIAKLLKPKLEALGARVVLVRETTEPLTKSRPENLLVAAKQLLAERGILTPKDSYAGLVGDARVLTVQYQAEKLFYRTAEIHARADKVNKDIKPDLTLCLHLNAAPWGDPANPTPSQENHFHTLINGCYLAGELQLADVRFSMLHRVLSRTHVEEKAVADEVTKAMKKSTGLPPFNYVDGSARLVSENGCLYARNLLANRIYQCPVIYLEPYVMNNLDTYRRVLMGHYQGRTLVDGKLRSSLYHDYITGIVEGLVAYYKARRKA